MVKFVAAGWLQAVRTSEHAACKTARLPRGLVFSNTETRSSHAGLSKPPRRICVHRMKSRSASSHSLHTDIFGLPLSWSACQTFDPPCCVLTIRTPDGLCGLARSKDTLPLHARCADGSVPTLAGNTAQKPHGNQPNARSGTITHPPRFHPVYSRPWNRSITASKFRAVIVALSEHGSVARLCAAKSKRCASITRCWCG